MLLNLRVFRPDLNITTSTSDINGINDVKRKGKSIFREKKLCTETEHLCTCSIIISKRESFETRPLSSSSSRYAQGFYSSKAFEKLRKIHKQSHLDKMMMDFQETTFKFQF